MSKDAMNEPMTDKRLEQLKLSNALGAPRSLVRSSISQDDIDELIAEVERLRKISVKRQLINDAFRGTPRKRKD